MKGATVFLAGIFLVSSLFGCVAKAPSLASGTADKTDMSVYDKILPDAPETVEEEPTTTPANVVTFDLESTEALPDVVPGDAWVSTPEPINPNGSEVTVTVGGDAVVPGSVKTVEGVTVEGVIEVQITDDMLRKAQELREMGLSPRLTPLEMSALNVYEVGQIMIVMYHGIVENPPTAYQRTPADFWNDMEELYKRGFRLAKMSDVIRGNITTAPGYTPIVFTFDDGLSSSFSLTKDESGNLVPVANTGVDLMIRFSAEHPDFGCTAAFFVNGYSPFDGAGTVEERFRFLLDWGFEIGNHTLDHASLTDLPADELQRQIAAVDKLIKETIPGYKPVGLAYPFGDRPYDELKPLVLNGSYDGQTYHNDFALSVGQSGGHASIYHKKFDPLKVPRVRGSDNEVTDLWDTIRFYDANPEYRYVSDGNPDTIAVPSEYASNVNLDAIGDKTLIIYDKSE